MTEVTFVLPNMSDIRPQRGGLSSRLDFARDLGCGYIEIPCDFIKNGGEVERTGLEMGSPLTPAAIAGLYDAETGPAPLPYILHTEPSLPRMDGCGLRMQAALRWYDADWTEKLVAMIVGVSERLNAPPAAVEIHPGDRRNGDGDVIRGMATIQAAFEDAFGTAPAVLLENRTEQFIRDGRSIDRFWNQLLSAASGLAEDCGIVLDVSQLFTVTGTRFLANLAAIPPDAIRALHIHTRHGTPTPADRIPWPEVFALVRRLDRPVLVNPEVMHLNQAAATIAFCRERL
ncbi:MAG: hypothetical protein ABFC89_13040 [Methanospirillum sp.]